MPSTGLDVFDTTIQKTNSLLGEIEKELNWENRRNQSYHALRVVLHTLRDRLPLDESVNFSAQLPLILKGVYFDGWNPNIVPIKMNRAEFIMRIGNDLRLDTKDGLEHVIKVVLKEITQMIGPEEMLKIMGDLPNDLAELFCPD